MQSSTTTTLAPISTQQLWRDAIAITTLRAKDTLGDAYHSRLDKAQAIVLANGVSGGHEGGAYQVVSESDQSERYMVGEGGCTCQDATRNGKTAAPTLPDGRRGCKHLLATMVFKRSLGHIATHTGTPAAGRSAAPGPAAGPLPEAPVSITLKGTVAGRPGTLVTLRGLTLADVQAQLTAAAQLFDADPYGEPVRPGLSGTTAATAASPRPPFTEGGAPAGHWSSSNQRKRVTSRAQHPETQYRKIEGFGDPDGDLPYCTAHATHFFRNVPKGGGKPWYSHRTAEGGWCRYNAAKA